MSEIVTYYTSYETTVNEYDVHRLGKIMQACISFRVFVVGYNVLEIANGPNKVLFALTMRHEPGVKEDFESLTDLKLILARVQGDDGEDE